MYAAFILTDIVHWLQVHQLACPIKEYLHIKCPGCGLQSSLIALLQGDILLSWQYHPATIPLLLFVLFVVLQLLFRFKKGNVIIVSGYIFISAIIASNYIYRIITQTLT